MEDPTDLAVELLEQADAAFEANALREADELATRACELFATEGENHPDVANAHLMRARIAHARGDFIGALVHADAASSILKIAREEWPDEDIVVRLHGNAVAQAAHALQGLGRYDDAERELVARLADLEQRLGPTDPVVGQLCNALGMTHKYQARYADGERCYARAIAIAGEDADPRMLASLYHNLGGLDHARGEYARAEPHARRSVELRESVLGPEHPEVAADLAAWATILDDLQRFGEAEQAYKRAIAIFEKAFGDAHHEVGMTRAALGAMYAGQQRWADARTQLTRARTILDALHGADHVEVAQVDQYLAVVLHGEGRLADALACAKSARERLAKALGDHPRVADAQATCDAISTALREE